jgi:hypothetical protein
MAVPNMANATLRPEFVFVNLDGLEMTVACDPALQIVQTMVVATMAHVSVKLVTAARAAVQV